MKKAKTAGIVAEFNPFHNGHALLLKKTREAGFSHIVVVMSGNYTQRGEAACMLKEARTRMALSCGADLVIELPLPWAVSSAENFAFGAVSLLNALGCVDALSFGSECGNANLLTRCAERLPELDGSSELAKLLRQGYSFPKARALALGKDENLAGLLDNPNDTLGIEYIKALKRLGSPIEPFVVERIGARHDGSPALGGDVMTASASYLRSVLNSDDPLRAKDYIPKSAAEILEKELSEFRAPFQSSRAEILILSQLRRLSVDDIKSLPDVSEGLENRILRAIRGACSLDELYAAIKSKRYTLARIRRIILCAYLGVDCSFTAAPPPYIRVLGFNARGQQILQRAKKSAVLPIVTRHADFAGLDGALRSIYELECRATDLYALCLPRALPCGLEQKFKTVRP